MVKIGDIVQTCVSKLDPVSINGVAYPVQFFQGVLSDVNEQINAYKAGNLKPYPAVWLLRDLKQIENASTVTINQFTLVLILDTEGSYRAPERLKNRIDPYLTPLKDALIKQLKLAGVFCSRPEVWDLTFLGNPNAAISAKNPQGNSKLFSDYLDGIKIVFNVSYQINLNLECYVRR